MSETSPVLVEVTRGGVVESRHRGRVAVVNREGHVVFSIGDVKEPVYPRSAIKPLQAIPLVESGAADDASPQEIAVACASHNGEAIHVGTILEWLKRHAIPTEHLQCGPHAPSYGPATDDLVRAGRTFGDIHNNCSGKHAGMLITARHLGEDTDGYLAHSHPVQQRVFGVLEQMCGIGLADAPLGIDGCGIPTVAIPLGNLALGFARFAAARNDVPERRAAATRRISQAIWKHPELMAGTARYCTDINRLCMNRALVKTGAEGVFCAALHELGLGIALKCEDGASRASEAIMSTMLLRLGIVNPDELRSIDRGLPQPILNRNRQTVGELRMTAALLDG